MKVRRKIKVLQNIRTSFNSRTREGATTIFAVIMFTNRSFNSRTREGATLINKEIAKLKAVSIHAPVKVRLNGDRRYTAEQMFQFTHP